MPSINGDLNYRYIRPVLYFPRSLVMLAGNTNPIQKTTTTRSVHILAAIDRPYWGSNRSDELTTMDPTSAVAGLRFLLPTPAQRASYRTAAEDDSTLGFPWDLDLGSLHRVAPIEVTADRWSTIPDLDFLSMDPLAMPAWDEAREVKVSQPEASYN